MTLDRHRFSPLSLIRLNECEYEKFTTTATTYRRQKENSKTYGVSEEVLRSMRRSRRWFWTAQ